MTEKQRQMARHALGLPNKRNESYRNRYCIGQDSEDWSLWIDLCEKKLALRLVSPMFGGDDMFYLTLAGALEAREPGEHISRSDAEKMRGEACL